MDHDGLDFEKTHAAFRPKIFRYLSRLIGEGDAEDLTQEVFLKVSRALGDFRGDSQLSTWLYRIATNAALDRMRSPSFTGQGQECSPESSTSNDEMELDDRNAWTGERKPLIEQELFRKEMNDCIRGFIGRLPEDCRTVLVLSEFEGLKNSEIAEILGVTLATVKIRLHRARERLKEDLMKNCDSYWVEDNQFLPELKLKQL
ncbi:MAG: sigma-70 family RNA polymerase sigma factor [Chloroflexota bacterium]